MKKTTLFNMDILGISSASLCLVHCLLFPLLTVLPLGLAHNSYIDLLLALIGLWAVVKIIKTASLAVIVLLLLSITLIMLSVLIDIFFDFHTNFLIIGGIGMIIGHVMNYKNHCSKIN
jgi:drug/metabolite transporter (DMT)-like permease